MALATRDEFAGFLYLSQRAKLRSSIARKRALLAALEAELLNIE